MKQDLDIIEQKLKTIVNLLNDLQEENKVLKDKINNQEEGQVDVWLMENTEVVSS